jgi:serine O-acetyltransferase
MSNDFSLISKQLLGGCQGLIKCGDSVCFPDIDVVIGIINKIKTAVFPGYHSEVTKAVPHCVFIETLIKEIHDELSSAIEIAMLDHEHRSANFARGISLELINRLPEIQELLLKDAEAGFRGDPAARSIDEVIITYPGLFAIFIHRIAHFLFKRDVPLIPRILSEYAHNITGIDIHPGAQIGEYFFIDHGTGVVIGETTVIGGNVKIYQGVTLGALSTKRGQQLAGTRRHPRIEDNVTIYSGATILGGDTVIGQNSTIGGNVFITESIPPDTFVRGT